jgi:signal peptidase
MKIFRKIINVVLTLIIVIGVVFLGLVAFGITPYVVLSGSMEPTIATGSLCFINKNAKYNEINKKDIIAFKLNDGTLITHRVINITDNGIQTKGDNNKKIDNSIVTKNNFIGKNIFWIPKLGYAVVVFQSTRGKIIFATCVILLLAISLLFGEEKKKD